MKDIDKFTQKLTLSDEYNNKEESIRPKKKKPTHILEVCCGDADSVIAANLGGADRIELCSGLSEGGLTPSMGIICEACKLDIPINVLIRPRGGDFCYSKAEVNIMLHDIEVAAILGAKGVVLGALTTDGTIHTRACNKLIYEAKHHGLEITFHRAFDMCSNPEEALEQLIEYGVDRLLTSGLAASALDGADQIRRLHELANGRIKIMAGCGVTPYNIAEIINRTGVNEIHASAKMQIKSPMTYINPDARMGAIDDYSRMVTSEDIVTELATIVHEYGYYEKY